MRQRAVSHRLQPPDSLRRVFRLGARGLLPRQLFALRFSLLAFCYVAEDDGEKLTAPDFDIRDRSLDRKRRAVRAQRRAVRAQRGERGKPPRLAGFDEAARLVIMRDVEALRDEAVERLPHGFGA